MAIRGRFPTGTRWGYAVLGFLMLILWAFTLALFLSAVNVYLRDVQHLVDVSMQVLMWASPIVYSVALVVERAPTWALNLYFLNPVTQAVIAFQRAFWVAGDIFEPRPSRLVMYMGIMLAFICVLLWLSQRLFARLQANFAQEL